MKAHRQWKMATSLWSDKGGIFGHFILEMTLHNEGHFSRCEKVHPTMKYRRLRYRGHKAVFCSGGGAPLDQAYIIHTGRRFRIEALFNRLASINFQAKDGASLIMAGVQTEKQQGRPHAVFFPWPAQGHIQPLMQLAKILNKRGFYTTFVNTDHTHERMLKSRSKGESFPESASASFRFEAVPDGMPPEHGRTLNKGNTIAEFCEAFLRNVPPHFEKLMEKLNNLPGVPRVTCIVSDGIVSFTQDIANKWGIPRISYWTPSACGFSAYFFGPLLIEKGYLPIKDESSLEEVVTCIPGMPPLRVKDLPSFIVARSTEDFMLQYMVGEALRAAEAEFVILNTFDELEKPVLDALRTRFPVYTIGPLLLLEEGEEEQSANGGGLVTSLWALETSVVGWLDAQRPGSVLYVSFGSQAVMSDEQLVEFAWGLEASDQPFLWVIRPDLIHGNHSVLPNEFMEKTRKRGYFAKWVPQAKVLAHPSVGGFLTHSGWNSTLESICGGVPMISRPFFAEQPTNRRFLSQVWKIGFEMNDVVERGEVDRMIRNLMYGEEGKEMRVRVQVLKEAAEIAVGKGGSSYEYLEKVVQQLSTKRAAPEIQGGP